MPKFEFAAPTSLDEALGLLAGPGEARPLAGGTDLIDQLLTGRKQADLVVDLKRIPELLRLDSNGDGLHIGGATSCTTVYHDPRVAARYAAVAEACGLIGSVQIQNRAAIGGNVCNAAPSADIVPPLLVHGARAMVAGTAGTREVDLVDFFVGPGETVLGRDELLSELHLPEPPGNSASAYIRFIPRNEMDIAVAGVASYLEIDPTTRLVKTARIALAAVAPTPVRATEAERVLEGSAIDDALIARAGEAAVESARPISDIRGGAEYRKELVKVLPRRTLTSCVERIDGGQ